ncbi:MAG: phytanoyl-CoA dioxygenase family protein [Gammaproteobacteria bacterium]|nr:phytanoyl-CoA dioxygenase family protein [Gammaproteobacteria bacterium]
MAETTSASDSSFGRPWDEINDLGLQRYAKDLDARGYCVIPPEIASPNGLAERMLEACLDIAERRNGKRPDLDRGRPESQIDSPVGDTMKALLLEDPVFEESLMNPVLLALATYLCGYDVVLSSLTSFMKGPGTTRFRLHTDTRLPSPLPKQALVCKGIYALTDFNRDNGSTAFVPSSHKWCRNPVRRETSIGEGGNDRAVPVDAPAGSLVVFHGNTWHGAYDRVAPGLRVSVHLLMVRSLLRATEDFIGRIPQEALDRNPPRFAILTQQGVVPGYIDKDDERAKVARAQKFVSAYEQDSGVQLPAKR